MKSELINMGKAIVFLISFGGTIIGLYQWWNSKSELSFNYKTVRLNDFIESNPYSSSIKFNINGKNYDSIFISHIKIENVGNSDIRKGDYEGKPIKFLLSKNLSIVETKDITHSDLFNPEITFSGDTIMIQPILFKKEFIVEFDLVSQLPITSVKSLSLIAGLDLISTNGFKLNRKTKNKTMALIDNVIFYVSLGFYPFLLFIFMFGRTSDNNEIKMSDYLKYRPTKRPYTFIVIVSWIMATLSFTRYFYHQPYEILETMLPFHIALLLTILLAFSPKGTVQPFKELEEAINDKQQRLSENGGSQPKEGQ